jgi:predicted RNase H-like nuclease
VAAARLSAHVAELVAGVDGCRAGWVVVLAAGGDATLRVAPRFADVLRLAADASVIGVDMPIGLLAHATSGGRECDRHARRLLGRPRACSVFSPPVRAALDCRSYPAALAANRGSSPAALGLSRQCFGLFDKLRDVDEALAARGRAVARVREVHPELAFRALAGRLDGLREAKSCAAGRARRAELLRPAFDGVDRALASRPSGVAADDVLDAFAVCWSAARIACGTGVRLPSRPPRDSRGLRMEIWY